MGNCLGGFHKVGVLGTKASGIQTTESCGQDMVAANTSAIFKVTSEQEPMNSSSTFNNYSDDAGRQMLSADVDENSLPPTGWSSRRRPGSQQFNRLQAIAVNNATLNYIDISNPQSRSASPISGAISPTDQLTAADFYYNYYNRGTESRNTNTLPPSPTSMDCTFLKVPSAPTPIEAPSPTLSVDARLEREAAPDIRMQRSKTIDSVSSNPDLFRSIIESTQVTREFAEGGYMRLNQYLLKNEIGRGSYGVVKLAYNEQDNKHYAMKLLSKKRLFRRAALQARNPKFRKNPFDPLEKLHREIAILKKLNHPNVVKLYEVLDDPKEDNLYLVFELVAQGEVLSIPTNNPLSEEKAWKYFRDTVLGLEYLHFQKVIHRDIKPANLLLDDQGCIKIADFGVSNQFSGADALVSSCTGTPVFLAPELLEPDPTIRANRIISGRAADIWSLGITLYCFLYGTVPWLETTNASLYKKILSEPLFFPDKPVTSSSVKHLIKVLLCADTSARWDLAKVKEHPWVTNNGKVPMPQLVENCIQITVTEEEVTNAVKHIPRLATLILIKCMIQNGSFRNPFHSAPLTGALARRARFSTSNKQFSLSGNPTSNTAVDMTTSFSPEDIFDKAQYDKVLATEQP